MNNPYILTLLVLAVLSLVRGDQRAWSQEPPAANSAPTGNPEDKPEKELTPPDPAAIEVIKEARSRLFQYKSVQADITQQVSLGDFRFQASGKYLAGEEFRSRVEYSVKLGEMEGVFLEVCDGQILHTRRQISEKQTPGSKTTAPTIELTRRDINKILRETQLYLDQPEAVRAAEIGIGGLPAILASLERTMVFEALHEETEAGRPVLIVQGRWNPTERDRLLVGLGGLASQIEQFLPDRVRITFEKETLFPTRFQYLKQISEEKMVYRPLLTVSFSNAIMNQPIPQQRFNYIPPPGMEERDETALFIEAIQMSAQPPAQKKSLKESI